MPAAETHVNARSASAALCLSVCASLIAGCAQPEPADLLVTDAAIYTLDEARPRAEAMAIRDGRILALGSSLEIRTRYDGPERNADGAMVLPGFHDAHVHPIGAGIDLLRCDLSGSQTIDALLSALADCDARDPGTHWLLGHGWSLGLFANGNPHKSLLDEVSTRRPILLQGADGHSSWANSLAIERAGLDEETPDPELGIIERDADGSPSGTLRESAQDLLWSLAPEPDREELDAALKRGVAELNRFGVTSIIEANATPEYLATYKSVDAAGELDVRVVVSRALEREDMAAQLASIRADASAEERGSAAGSRRVASKAVKIFLDGVLEGETAALLDPYLTSTATTRNTPRGRLRMEPSTLAGIVTELDAAGIQVHVHAIGDRAVRTALDAFETARRVNGPSDGRHHIAHLQLVHPDDYPRFAELGVTANFQAVWAFPDDYIMNINLPQVGPERVERMYPIGSLVRAGARIVAGSDWNVTTANPLEATEVALTRRDPSGRRSDVLNANEAVDLDTMLRAYTVNGAWLMHQESENGMLAPGFDADFVILDRDLFEIPASEISEVRVLATYLAGNAVFEASERAADRGIRSSP